MWTWQSKFHCSHGKHSNLTEYVRFPEMYTIPYAAMILAFLFLSKTTSDSPRSDLFMLLQVILFSDILTPLTGMNIPFDIEKSKGPIIHHPIRTAADVSQVRELVPAEAVPYVGEALTALRSEVRLTFIAVPVTLVI